ncbi:polysaccharide biosynthesis C-terminal domain-containing protein [Alphaproteobacteria bacterium]|nr:polysaccharide biosynthesis C-terminal domain-containing protein [Alphaproteobacteria bacterium]
MINLIDLKKIFLNGFGIFFLGLVGLLINLVITKFYTLEILATYNQLLAIYFVFSHFSCLGLNLTTQHYLCSDINKKNEIYIIRDIIVIFLGSSFVTIILMVGLADLFSKIINNESIIIGIKISSLTVSLFALNKILSSILICKDKLYTLGFTNLFRGLGWLIFFFIFSYYYSVNTLSLSLILLIGEILLALFQLIILKKYFQNFFVISFKNYNLSKIFKILNFTLFTFPASLISEFNSRIDIFLVSIFSDLKLVGIYSFASMIVEGVSQIGVVVRNLITADLSNILRNKNQLKLKLMKKKYGNLNFLFTFIVSFLFICIIYFNIFKLNNYITDHIFIFLILFTGIVLSSIYAPLSSSFVLSGFPKINIKIIIILMMINIILSIILIPIISIYGAALSSLTMQISYIILIKYYYKKILFLKI